MIASQHSCGAQLILLNVKHIYSRLRDDKHFFNECDAFINDPQQDVFKLSRRQNIVFVVSGLSRKLIR